MAAKPTFYLLGVSSYPVFTVVLHVGRLRLKPTGNAWEDAAFMNQKKPLLESSWKQTSREGDETDRNQWVKKVETEYFKITDPSGFIRIVNNIQLIVFLGVFSILWFGKQSIFISTLEPKSWSVAIQTSYLGTSPRRRLSSPAQTCPPDSAADRSESCASLRSAHQTRAL